MNGFNWKWLVVGIAVGVGVMYLYAYAATAEARAKVAVLEETLEKQKGLTELAAQRADDAEALARLADEDLARVTAEEEARRVVLQQRISNRNATIAQLRDYRSGVDRELAFRFLSAKAPFFRPLNTIEFMRMKEAVSIG